ncbi:MAG: MmgE/PrpD family protein [Acidimicrobiales bacterium]
MVVKRKETVVDSATSVEGAAVTARSVKVGQTVAERLADYISGLRFEDLPVAVVDKAKNLLVYHLSLGFAGHTFPAGQTAVRLAQELSGDGGSASIIGAPGRVGPLAAALANSGLMCQTHQDDFVPSSVHPGVVVHPAAWAIGEDRHVSGRELLTAVVAGYDAMSKLSDPATNFDYYGRRPQYPFAPFGVAATSARLLGLAPDLVAQAMAHAGHAGMGVVEGSEHYWNVDARLTTGGMMAAYLARAGALAAPTTIEGAYGFYRVFFGAVPDGLDASLDRLRGHFAICAATTKPESASGANIPAMQVACELRTCGAFNVADVAGVRVVLAEKRRGRDAYFEGDLDRRPTDSYAARLSLRFRIAAIMLDGRIDLTRIGDPGEPDLRAMLDRVTLDYEAGHTIEVAGEIVPAVSYARVEITTHDGRTFSGERDRVIPPPTDWRAWLRRDGASLVGVEQLDRLEALMARLEDVADVAEVMASTRPATHLA